jgi:CRISPR-associated protein Csm2
MADNKWKAFPGLTEAKLKAIITDKQSTETLVKCAEEIGTELAENKLTTSQIRAIFGEVRRIEGEWKSEEAEVKQQANRSLILLRPKMAYRARKEKGRGVEDLVSVLDPAIDHVKGDEDNFKRFVDFFEAILAYHKAHGGT